jgi:GNAT superfamily N-acetyltransferase
MTMAMKKQEECFWVREALEKDVPAIRDIFKSVYSDDYPYPSFYDEDWLKRSVFSDDILMLVAEHRESGEILGTASVMFETGAYSDLVGEFGRLVVRPDARCEGVGKRLMEKRIECVESRLHVGIVENRTVHSNSQRISRTHGFSPVGFLPLKLYFRRRESMALFARHFGDALELRANHPRIIPEAHVLAHMALENCGLPFDAIVDEEAPPYPSQDNFELEELTSEGLPSLLRIERGRVRNREVFGPMRLQYGFFRLTKRHATYLVARERASDAGTGPVAGAIGYIHDELERNLHVFELITNSDDAVRFLLEHLLDFCGKKLQVDYVEVDVSTKAPRMQRTLLELGFLPAAYVPAMVFCDVERVDVLRMVRLLTPFEVGPIELIPEVQPVADQVINAFTRQEVLPAIAEAVNRIALFTGLTREQTTRVAGTCSLSRFKKENILFAKGDPASSMYLLIQGKVRVSLVGPEPEVGQVVAGESVGEVSLLTSEPHSATITAKEPVLAAVLSGKALAELIRQRPDIGVVLYRNLAVGLGRKLRRADEYLVKEGESRGN